MSLTSPSLQTATQCQNIIRMTIACAGHILPLDEKLCNLNNHTPGWPILLDRFREVMFSLFDPGRMYFWEVLTKPAWATPDFLKKNKINENT